MKSRSAICASGAPKPRESELQIALCDWLRLVRPACLYWHTANGGLRSKSEAVRFRRMGVLSGVVDLIFIGMPRCPVAFVELKTVAGRLSSDQGAFIDRCNDLGVPVHVVSADDTDHLIAEVNALLVDWGALR